MSQDCSHENPLAEQALEDFLSCLSARLGDIQHALRLLPFEDERQDELVLLLCRWSHELDALEEHISSSPQQGSLWPCKEETLPKEVRCANPACSQTFWKWRSADPQRFCSPACVRQAQFLSGQPRKSTHAHQGRGRVNPGVAEANRRRGVQRREQQAHEYALQLLAEAGLVPAEPELYDEGGV